MNWMPHGAAPGEPLVPVLPHFDHTAFETDRYVWDAWRPGEHIIKIELSKGYFAFCDTEFEDMLGWHSWWANVQLDRHTGRVLKVYAAASVKGKNVYLHRHVAKAGLGVHIDHRNGLSLDDRMSNLRAATHSTNMANSVTYRRKTHKHLQHMRGVEIRAKNTFGWQFQCKHKIYRSKSVFSTPEEAYEALLSERQRFFGHTCIDPVAVRHHYPIFPPTKEEYADPNYIPF